MSVKAVCRQFGSKMRVAPRLLALLPPGKRIWVELFAGSAALTLAKTPHHSEHINDLDGDFVNLFRVLRDDGQRARLIELIELTPWAQGEFEDCRAERRCGEPVEDARRFLVRSWMGVSNDSAKATGFKVDMEANTNQVHVWGRMPARLAAAAMRLKRVHVHQTPAIELVKRWGSKPDLVFFADPPYPPAAINTHTSPYWHDMTAAEHEAFALEMRGCRAAVILTMAEGTIYDEVLADWRQAEIAVRGMKNTTNAERVFMNYDPPLGALFDTAAPAFAAAASAGRA